SAGKTDSTHLPALLKNSDTLLIHSEIAVDSLADVSDSFKQYKGLMGVVHAATQSKGLFSYGTGLLSFLGGSGGTVGVKKPGSGQTLKHAMPAKQWATAA